MNFVNFFVQLIRGWLPEEPKMPKSKLKQLRTPIAILAVATAVVSLFSYSVFFSSQTAALLPPPMIVQGTPNSSYVELQGVSDTNNSFILVLANGSHICSENLTMAFSVTERSGNKCIVHIAVECDGFSNEASVDGSIVDGNLVIGSTRSIFLINPNVTGKNIVLTETGDWRLDATVDSKTGKASTAIDPYGVTALLVSSSVSRTEEGWPLNVHLGYDPATGILVYSGFSLSDVLLKELGIELLLGGGLKLVSYSENLNLEVVNLPSPQLFNFGFILFLVLVSSSVILSIAAVVHIIRKISKRTQAGVNNIPELHDDSTQNCDKKGW